MKKLLILFVIITLFSCSQKVKLPELDENKFGKIIGVWEHYKKNNEDSSRYIIFTDKLYWLEYWPSESKNWKDLDETKKSNLVEVEKNTYVFDFLWNGDWKAEWKELTKAEKEFFGNIDILRKQSVIYYVINENGDLAEGAFATFKNAPEKIIIHKKVEYY